MYTGLLQFRYFTPAVGPMLVKLAPKLNDAFATRFFALLYSMIMCSFCHRMYACAPAPGAIPFTEIAPKCWHFLNTVISPTIVVKHAFAHASIFAHTCYTTFIQGKEPWVWIWMWARRHHLVASAYGYHPGSYRLHRSHMLWTNAVISMNWSRSLGQWHCSFSLNLWSCRAKRSTTAVEWSLLYVTRPILNQCFRWCMFGKMQKWWERCFKARREESKDAKVMQKFVHRPFKIPPPRV